MYVFHWIKKGFILNEIDEGTINHNYCKEIECIFVHFCYINTYRAYGNGYGYPPQQGPPYGYPQQNGYNYGYNPQLPPNYPQGII